MKLWRGILLLAALCMMPAAHAAVQAQERGLEEHIGGLLEHAVLSGQTVGATIAVVKDGRLLTSQGYGMADLARGQPVQALATQFRIGSISKVLIWIAVMQQVEAGRLDLEADVNSYLTSFQLPDDFTAPITLRHLMTHTAGFEDNLVNLFVSGPRQVGELGATLAENIPARVRLPGTVVSYSNYGAALAAYVVTQVSGTDWDDYVEANIFTPLGMLDSTTRQPVPETIERTRAKGYLPNLGGYSEQGFTYVPMGPAGAASATAVDVAKLMAELLNPGDSRILSAASKAELLTDAYVVHPEVNGMALGIYEMSLGKARAVGHDGNTILFNSRMVLWPERNLGLFVSTNTAGAEAVATDVVNLAASRLGLLDPPPQTGGDDLLDDVTDGSTYEGFYLSTRRNYSNHTKLMGMMDAVQVAFDAQTQSLVISGGSGTHRYRQLKPGVFQRVDGNTRVGFQPGSGITPALLYFSDRPVIAYAAAQPFEQWSFNALLLLGWLTFALGALLVWPVSSLTHRDRETRPGQRWLALLCYASCLVLLAFFAQLMGVVGDSPYDLLLQGLDQIPPLLWWPLGFVILVLIQLLSLPRVLLVGFWWPSRRLHFSLLLIMQCALAWWLWQWNLLPGIILEYLK